MDGGASPIPLESPASAAAPAVGLDSGPPPVAVVCRDVRRVYRSGAMFKRRSLGDDRAALDGLTFEAPAGRWTVLLGPNGSGKSTLLRLLATLDRADGGEISVLGRALPAYAQEVRERIGVVFQRPGLDTMLTPRENLLLQAELHGMDRDEAEGRAASLAVELGFADRQRDRVGRLSGGLQRRVDLARALMTRPALLLLDEPTTGLDLDSRRAFLDLVAARIAADGMTALMTSHLIEEADRADLVVMMSAGRVAAAGAPSELRRSLGGTVVRAPREAADAIKASGLTLERLTATEAIGTGDVGVIEHAAGLLVRDGVWFQVGPPTLADVFLARTGSPLSGAASSTEVRS
jgi:ABC-2 type transport system ATP-binding protein